MEVLDVTLFRVVRIIGLFPVGHANRNRIAALA